MKSLPPDLNETYARALDKIEQRDKLVARRALSFLCSAGRPPSLAELAEAAIIEPGMESMDPELRWFPQDLLHIIGSLIIYTAEDDIIMLAHHSVKEYLESDYIRARVPDFYFTPSSSHVDIATTCLTYLLLSDFSSGQARTQEDFIKHAADYPLLLYASRYWPLHAQPLLSTSPTLLMLANKLLDPSETPNFRFWLVIMTMQGHFSFSQSSLSRAPVTAASTAASLRSPSSNTHTSLKPRKPKTYFSFFKDTSSLTPLYYAASFGLAPVVESLIRAGADINKPGGMFGGTPLHAAGKYTLMNWGSVAL